MLDLFRSSDGLITRREFRHGSLVLIVMSVGAVLIVYGLRAFSQSMDWMTVAVAPVFGLVAVFGGCSLLYFWFCLFAKRLRAMNQSLHLLYAWLAAIFLTAASALLAYQNATLDLGQTGPLSYAYSIAVLFAFLVGLFFLILLGICWLGPRGEVAQGQCFPTNSNE